jgi:lipopolysaccharide transport system permease protein
MNELVIEAGKNERHLCALNPMVAMIGGYRWALGDNAMFDAANLLNSLMVTALLLFSGVKYFRATEKAFADLI